MNEYNLEEELAAAMRERAVRHRPGTYDAAGLVRRVRRRRRRLQAGVAAAVTVVALGAGFAAQAGRDRDTASVPPRAPALVERADQCQCLPFSGDV